MTTETVDARPSDGWYGLEQPAMHGRSDEEILWVRGESEADE